MVALLIDAWTDLTDRQPLVLLIARSIERAGPFELDEFMDGLLTAPAVVPEVAHAVAGSLRHRSQSDDAAAGIALEALVRLALGGWIASLPIRSALVERAASLSSADATPDETLVRRLVRSLGAVGERWPDPDIVAALRTLLRFPDTADDVTFELAMLELRAGLEEGSVDKALARMGQAHEALMLCAQQEDRIDAQIFASSIDSLLTFAAGGVPAASQTGHLRQLVIEYRLATVGEDRHWRQPRADTAVQWLELADYLAAVSDLDQAWLSADRLIPALARVYRSHRTIELLRPPEVVATSSTHVPVGTPALRTLLQPRIEAGISAHPHGLELLDRWLQDASEILPDPADKQAADELRQRLRADGGGTHPKGHSVDLSTLKSVLPLSSAQESAVADALAEHPAVARLLNQAAGLSLLSQQEDLNEYVYTTFRRLRDDLMRVGDLNGEVALRAEQIAKALLRYVRWRLETEAGGQLAATYQRPFKNRDAAPKEVELANDLLAFLAGTLPVRPYTEVKHIAGGRVDIILFFGACRLVIECKRELTDASAEHLSKLYTVQAADYGVADAAVGFLVVLDLTPKDRRAELHQCLWITTVPPAEAEGRPHAVLVARVQGNVQPPSFSSTATALRRRNAPTTSTTRMPRRRGR